jgi:hypothetical protein
VFGRLDDLRARGAERVQQLQQNGYNAAQLYDPTETSVRGTQRKSRLEIGHVLFSRLAAFGEVTGDQPSPLA